MFDTQQKQSIRRAFSQAALDYDAVADVQKTIATNLLKQVPDNLRGLLLDAGAGTGFGSRHLTSKCDSASVIGLDAAYGMCRHAGLSMGVCGDIESLPLAEACIDLYWSSLAWQWTRPELAIAEAARVLKPGGLLRVATLGPNTLWELKSAFAQIDAQSHVRNFDAPEKLLQHLEASGFSQIQLTQVTEYSYGADLFDLLRGIRDLGAHVLDRPRQQGLKGRRFWASLQQAYEHHRSPLGLPASYDVLYLSAVKA